MRKFSFLIVVLFLCTATVACAEEQRPVGLVKTASGEAEIVRDGRTIAARPGTALMQHDLLTTGKNSTLGVILTDDTVLSLGPSSKLHIAEFSFEPHRGRLGMVLKVTRGIIEYLSGQIAKLAPGAVRIETPVATLGIRGTRLLVRIDS